MDFAFRQIISCFMWSEESSLNQFERNFFRLFKMAARQQTADGYKMAASSSQVGKGGGRDTWGPSQGEWERRSEGRRPRNRPSMSSRSSRKGWSGTRTSGSYNEISFINKITIINHKKSKTLRGYFNHKKKTKGFGTTIERLFQS
jgi:hypothetical protein